MSKKLTLQEYIKVLQQAIDTGMVSGNSPVAVCCHANPRYDYWFLTEEHTVVEKHDDLAIVTY